MFQVMGNFMEKFVTAEILIVPEGDLSYNSVQTSLMSLTPMKRLFFKQLLFSNFFFNLNHFKYLEQN